MKFAVAFLVIVAVIGGWTRAAHPSIQADAASLRAFLPQWEEAQTRFINGDPSLWKQYSSRRDDVTILGGFGGYGEKGWSAVGGRYDWASSQYKPAGATMKVEYLNIGVSGNLGYTVAIERQHGARVRDQVAPVQRALRATQVFRREEGAWKLVHRHADPLVEKQ